MSRYPMPMPFGWYAVAFGEEIGRGEVKPLRYFDRDLVLFRGEEGEAHLLDAFCPHLGAHLGHGGKVKGDSIACPFHGWEWNGDGSCAKVPYADTIPPRVQKTRLRHYPLQERNGAIYAWYHPKDAAPSWQVEAHDDMQDWSKSEVRRFSWEVKAHIQEMAENSVDAMHFIYVHGIASFPDWEIVYDGHKRRNILKFDMATPRDTQEGGIETISYGAGESVQWFTGIHPMMMLGLSTPIDAETTHLRFVFFKPLRNGKKRSGGIAEAIIREICRQVEQDIPIWENKAYCPRPFLAAREGDIMEFRRHYGQFYADYDEKARVEEMRRRGEGKLYMPAR